MIRYSDPFQRSREFLRQKLRNRASETANNGMILRCYYGTCLF
jgi:hypothetical protein